MALGVNSKGIDMFKWFKNRKKKQQQRRRQMATRVEPEIGDVNVVRFDRTANHNRDDVSSTYIIDRDDRRCWAIITDDYDNW